MSRILLLFLEKQHNILLLESLETRYEIISPDLTDIICQKNRSDFLLNISFDLCILDTLALTSFRDSISLKKSISKAVFLPFLLWLYPKTETAYLSVIDELIINPFTPIELQTRVASLLRSRQFSLENQELHKINKLKTNFISMTSHELRNPLSAILFSTQLLQELSNQTQNDPKLKYFQLIQERVKYMTEMLDSLLLINKADIGKLEFNPSIINVEKFCRRLVEEMQLSVNFKQEFILMFEGNCQQVNLDSKLLQHILSNLISNAIKYSSENSTIKLEVSCLKKEIVFLIKDKGIGIPTSDRLKLFQSFHRGANVGKIIGTGLGLTIVKQCVDIHKGKIDILSDIGVGSTFIVTLPIESRD